MQSPRTTSAATPAAAPAGPAPVRPATMLLRDLLDVTDAFEKSLGAALRVNPTDLDAMQHLLMSGPLSPTELARRVGLSTAATTTSIDRLVALGHVHREPNPQDRRGVIVVPSPASRVAAMSRLMPMIASIDDALDEFDDAEQAVITRYLDRVVGEYRRHAAEPGAEPGADERPSDDPTAATAEG